MLDILKKIGWVITWPFMAILCSIEFFSCNTAAKRYQKDKTCATVEERYNKVKKLVKHFLYWKDIKIELTKKEKIENKVMLFVSNHKSNVDPLVILKVVLDQNIPYVTFVAKKELEGTKIGNIASLIDVVFLDRQNLRKAIIAVNQEVELLTKESRSVCIFPEGTRVLEDEFLDFKPGALEAAYQTYKTIQPIVICNSKGLLEKKCKYKGNRRIKVSLMKAYQPNEYINVDKTIFSKKLKESMYTEYLSLLNSSSNNK